MTAPPDREILQQLIEANAKIANLSEKLERLLNRIEGNGRPSFETRIALLEDARDKVHESRKVIWSAFVASVIALLGTIASWLIGRNP